MKKLGLLFREIAEKRIKNNLKDSDSVFIAKYSGLSGPAFNTLRMSLKGSQANMFVVKNAVARRALKDSGAEDIVKTIEGPCALIFIKDEPVTVSRILHDFIKTNEKLVVEGGFFKDRVLNKKDIERLAKLPTKEVLRAQVVMTLNSPIAGFARALSNTLRKFVICLDQIKQKKEKTS